MAMLRMDHTGIVVTDMQAAISFFTELGMELEGEAPVSGEWVDRINGIDGIRCEIAMLRTPDGMGRLEICAYQHPPAINPEPCNAPPNTTGLRSVMFEVDDIDDTVRRLHAHGSEMLGEIVQYESSYRLCYMRGPAGIIVALAEATR